MKTWVSVLLIISFGASLFGCSNMNSAGTDITGTDSSKAYIGMFSGAILGGLVGSAIGENGGGRLTAAGIGAVVGALIGGGLGMIMDEKDRLQANPKAPAYSSNNVVKNAEDRSNSWQHATGTATSPASTTTTTTTTTSAAVNTTATTKVATPAKTVGMNEKFLGLWRSLPSTQWFFDDGKQAEVG